MKEVGTIWQENLVNMKVGDMVRNKVPGTTITHNIGMILEIFQKGDYPSMFVRLLWNQGHQTVEFMEDIVFHYDVINAK